MTASGNASQRQRLDELLVSRGDFATRSRARDAIGRGTVTVDGRVAAKPGQPVSVRAVEGDGRSLAELLEGGKTAPGPTEATR